MSANSDARAALEHWRSQLAAGGRDVRGFDAYDGGAVARLLLLLEPPGAHGPTIVSRDHATGTSLHLKRSLDEAAIDRRATLLWNAVPWNVPARGERNRPLRRSDIRAGLAWNVPARGERNRPLRRGEIRAGLALLPPLLHLLPQLEIVVLADRIAREPAALMERGRPGAVVLTMPHPSPTYLCTSPAVPQAIAATLAEAAAQLSRAGAPAPR